MTSRLCARSMTLLVNWRSRPLTGSFTERGNAARDLDLMVRQATGIAKARAVADVVRILVEGGEPVFAIFGWHRAVYDIWLERLADLNPAMYTGSESRQQKVEIEGRLPGGSL